MAQLRGLSGRAAAVPAAGKVRPLTIIHVMQFLMCVCVRSLCDDG